MTFRLRVVTPERVFAEYQAASVSLPTPEGEITILPHHVPFASLIASGVLRIVHENKTEEFAISGGFVEVAPETRDVTVLADFAEQSEELNIAQIEAAKARAEAVMKEVPRNDEAQYAAAAAALERELARYRVAVRHRSQRGLPMSDKGSISHDKNAS
jgi:F-type H+-transporting ATPase subunit epsilon